MSTHGLELSDVAISRGGVSVLSGVTVSLASQQIVSLIGANGAGKSTLLAAAADHLPFHGTIRWNGKPVTPDSVGYMPQSSEVQSGLSVLETVLLGRFDRLGWRVDLRDLDAAALALDALGLGSLARRRLDSLSGGQRQLVLLAQRLVRQPQLLLLDESTSALDLRHQMNVLDHLRSYVERTGALVLIAIHDLNLAARHSDRMLLLANGTLSANGSCSEVVTADNLRHGFGIEAEILTSSCGRPTIVPIRGAPHIASTKGE